MYEYLYVLLETGLWNRIPLFALMRILRCTYLFIRIENQLVVEQLFKTVWADHADLISIQYTGTGKTELLGF
jgi:hypothetical protein